MEPDDYRVTIRLSPHLYAQLEARGSHGQPLAAIVREALEAFLAQPRQPPADMAVMAANIEALQAQMEQLAGQLAAMAAMRLPLAAEPETPAAERQPEAATRPTPPATAEGPLGPLPAHIAQIAVIAADYDKLSLSELAELLFTRNVYRARDRATGVEKPVNRGTLGRWLEQAREAGAL